MARQFEVEFVTEHEYVVRADSGAQVVESWFHIEPEVLRQLGVGDADESRVVERTAEFLAERQDVEDFPNLVHIEDVVATYDDYPERLRRSLGV
ncbi:MAG TPA: hypothetical protein VJT49_29480 [Amycolatopsis sp.]|uniref:hypothetical protein n=1 Tax=Amycolatopsis sp. TaxID=37632 RepID=UPI002B496E80|nr:hypothetical protein [Amycolatopsis sp.]HKS49169.1 hypothetical protein [Amycolatopsis sp.]